MNNSEAPGNMEQMAHIVDRNITALLKRHEQEEQRKSLENKVADSIARFTGSMPFVYIHLVLFGLWIIWNLGWIGLRPFDPSFVTLAMFASVEAIFLSTIVLISQNRMNAQADKRADLDLQVSLLTEHEVTQLLNLVKEMAKKMDIREAYHPELEELSKDVQPEKVLDTMEKHKSEIERGGIV
ncbi:MAG: rane protein [Ferruginibacter sp.]|nr:rane protein [Ferruginibacter sp.]